MCLKCKKVKKISEKQIENVTFPYRDFSIYKIGFCY